MTIGEIDVPPLLVAATIAGLVYTLLAVICAIAESRFRWRRPMWASVSLIIVAMVVLVCLGAWLVSVNGSAAAESQLSCPTSPAAAHTYANC